MLLKNIVTILLIISFMGLAQASDQNAINTLLNQNAGGICQLPDEKFTITSPFSIPSNTELRGSENTILEFAENCKIPQNIPMIDLTNVNNIKVTNIKFKGNQETQKYAYSIPNPNHPEQNGKKAFGNQVNTFIFAKNCNNVTVIGCDFYDNLGDGLRTSGCTNIEFAYNTASMGGHDVLFCIRTSGVKAHHNNINPLVNSGIRLMDVSHARIYNNIINWVGPRDAGPSIQIQHDSGVMKDIEVCGNIIRNSWGPGLWLVGKTSGNEELWLHHNLFENSGENHGIVWVGGIIASGYTGALIENNCFDGSYLGAVNFYAVNGGWATAADATLKNNLFINAVPGKYSGLGGYGIYNNIDKQKVLSSGNCFYNNIGGDIKGSVTSQGDSYSNPNTNFGVWSYSGGSWSCPDIEPSVMGGIPSNDYVGLPDIPEVDMQKFEFNNIFDILNTSFVDSARTNQTAEDIQLEVKKTENGIVAGGIKIIGFKDKIVWNNETYIPDNQSVLVKSEAIKTPSLNFFNVGIDRMDKTVSIKIENGTATATLKVTTSYYSTSKNKLTGSLKKGNFKTSVVEFNDSMPSPNVLERPANITGMIYEYPPFFMCSVPSNGLTKVRYEYKSNSTDHIYAVGERQTDEKGIQYTEFSDLEHWEGEMQHEGDWIKVFDVFDRSKLKVVASTPYENIEVSNFTIIQKIPDKEPIARWFYVELTFLILCFVFIWWLKKQIFY